MVIWDGPVEEQSADLISHSLDVGHVYDPVKAKVNKFPVSASIILGLYASIYVL